MGDSSGAETRGSRDGVEKIAKVGAFARPNWTAQTGWSTGAQADAMDGTRIYFFIFGALTIIGGIIGYAKAGSVPSIIAGAITGVLLLIAASLLPTQQTAALATALVVSILLALQFVPKVIRTGKIMPAGLMSILSVIGIVVAIVAWLKK